MSLTDQHGFSIHTMALKRITSLDVSPDGRRLAFTVMQAVMASEQSSFQSQVHLADLDGSQTIHLTAGECSSFAPQWSPGGQLVQCRALHCPMGSMNWNTLHT